MARDHLQEIIEACSACIAEHDQRDAKSYPEALYHLTDIRGFVGIISAQRLRASLATGLNDALEVRYGLDLAIELLRERVRPQEGQFDDAVLGCLVGSVDEPQERQFELFPLVISFFASCDKSGQWLNYGRSGKGIALGFHPQLAQSFSSALSRVDYDRSSQRKRIAELIEVGARAMNANSQPQEVLEAAQVTATFVSWLALRMKHPAFAEENEWRLCARVNAIDGQLEDGAAVKDGQFGDDLVPYEERPFSETRLLEEVVLGYSSPVSTEAARLVLRNHGFGAAVRRSAVPVR